MIESRTIKATELIQLFKLQSCKNKIEIEYSKANKYESFSTLIIRYFQNEYGIENNEANELEIVFDITNRIDGIELETAGDRCSRTPAWKFLCKAVAEY